MVLEHLMNNQPLIANLQDITVYSDSLSSLELLSSASQYKMDIDTFHFLIIINNLASKGIRTYPQYVPSRSGITGNHQADKITKKCLIICQPSGRPIPIRDVCRWQLSDLMVNKIIIIR